MGQPLYGPRKLGQEEYDRQANDPSMTQGAVVYGPRKTATHFSHTHEIPPQGKRLRHVAVIEDLVAGPADAAVTAVAAMQSVAALERIGVLEQAGRSRKTVLQAVTARIAELTEPEDTEDTDEGTEDTEGTDEE